MTQLPEARMHRARPLAGVAALALVLAACSGGGNLSSLLPTSKSSATSGESAAPPAAAAVAPAAPAPAAPSRAAPAGRAAQGAPLPQTGPNAAASITTPEQINADCWMVAEANKKLRDLDARLKAVQQCVDERSRGR